MLLLCVVSICIAVKMSLFAIIWDRCDVYTAAAEATIWISDVTLRFVELFCEAALADKNLTWWCHWIKINDDEARQWVVCVCVRACVRACVSYADVIFQSLRLAADVRNNVEQREMHECWLTQQSVRMYTCTLVSIAPTDQTTKHTDRPALPWHCWLGLLTYKTRPRYDL